MKLLLDTHVFLWFISGDKRLPDGVCDSIRDLNNEVYLSVVSQWEATVKYQLGKLPLPQSPETYVPAMRQQHQITSLSLDETSVSRLVTLPLLHRDPFGRVDLSSVGAWPCPGDCRRSNRRLFCPSVKHFVKSVPKQNKTG